jgi:hypothetical protein
VNGDEARARWHLIELGRGPDGKGLLTIGVYHDRYRRKADGWRFGERRFHALYSGPPDLSATPAGWRDDF